ncbi:hypothetical protein AUC70_00130 [Methyloceanibacter stevinii]|uniref:Autotransporter domain-containing protein n=1 Tax=Methyloceanibacter stevinii TaxID=1774970 RepID=A0A1E3VV98_9HYPH|nr:hypothetical protein AUC70_00130 [Methyloceanibacter stevinii]
MIGTNGPILINDPGKSIDCDNSFDRNNAGNVIELRTDGGGEFISLDNYGDLTSTAGRTILAYSEGANSRVEVINTGDLDTYEAGIYARTRGDASELYVYNSGHITGFYKGIWAVTGAGVPNDDSPMRVINTGDIDLQTGESIDAATYGVDSDIFIFNSGALTGETGIRAFAEGDDADVKIINTGSITVQTGDDPSFGISGSKYSGENGRVTIRNSGEIMVTGTGGFDVFGINARTYGSSSPVDIRNTAAIWASGSDEATGINGATLGGSLSITNSGKLDVTGTNLAQGIAGASLSDISINNSADIHATSSQGRAEGIKVFSLGFDDNATEITNSGDIRASGGEYAFGIVFADVGSNGALTIHNSGSVHADGPSTAPAGNVAAISVYSQGGLTTIFNTGDISASSHLAIGFNPNSTGKANIFNAGHITGLVDLTSQNDRFVNLSGGVFETKKMSLFGGGEDVFVNQTGATVLAATNANSREMSGFEGLETFKNAGGTISLVDGGVGDTFTLANTPGSADLKFEGGGYLAVDASLRGPGSKADNFIVDGDVSGVTKVMVNNTGTQPGVFNSQGIPIVFVDGKTPSAGNFVLADGPIDTGFFDYDLFFVPTGSGYWELRSFPGASAQALPKLLTAAQDLWHETSSTWFDRTADLRVVLNGGGSPAYDAGTKSMAAPGGNGLTPGVWIKGGGSRLDRNGSATTKAYGNTYDYDLDNELSTVDLQMGVDMGKYDVLSEGDVLVFGVLGGFVGAGLDYDSVADSFNFSGGQVGAYATYLKDGLFVDTLLNVHLYEIDTPNLGFPDSLNATTVGLRTDAGYRFGSFTGGAFFEPLATIEFAWADIDGFNVGGNKVSFSDDANVRGRIGGRVGTTMEACEGTMMEPFLIASLWGNLSEDNAATLVSSGTTFNFSDDLDDVWGELSAGVNLFNFSQTTAVFAKVDYTFGEDVQGLGGKAGMRVAW